MKSSMFVLPSSLVLAAVLTGCGGSDATGASSSSTLAASSGSDASSALMISPTQQSANQLVAAANSSTMDIATAQSVSGLPSGLAALPLTPTASFSGDYECSALGSNGSGSISYTGTIDLADGVPQSLDLSFDDCVYTAFRNTYSYNGTESTSYSSYTSATQFTLVESWDLTLQISGAWSYERTFNGSASCTQDNSALSCSYDLGTSQISAGFAASQNGSVVTVSSATLTSRTLNMVLNDWVYDATLGYATSGSITITDTNGNTCVITADGNGTYTVTDTVNAVSSSYTVVK